MVYSVKVDHEVAFLVKDVQCDLADVAGDHEEWVLANQLQVDVI